MTIARTQRARALRTTGPMRNRIAFFPEHAAQTDPFLALAEDWVDAGGGFPQHAHRGFETVTLVLEGSQEHRDSTGSAGVLGPGDVQWMTAGRGVLHSEMPRGGFHGLQLWVNLPAREKGRAPQYQDLRAATMPTVAAGGATVRVIAGEHAGTQGAARTATSMTVLDVAIDDGASFVRTAAHRALAYVIGGTLAGHPDGTTLFLEPGEHALEARGATRVLWMEGAPIGEPIVAHGPFVMNTQQEIEQAIADLRAGRIGR